jgi:NADP-dependent 3-hydroxy acid dehydrogenase YdfG
MGMTAPREPLVVVVTGASSGVGRAIVRELATHGARIGLIARGIDGLGAAAEEVAAAGGEALVLPLDLANADAVEAAANAVVDRWGHIDVWINNAMVSVFSPISEMRADEFRRVTEVTYLGAVYGTCAALRRMRARDRGHIIQIGSALAYRSIPLQSAYCGAKSAMRGFTDSLRSELIHDGSHIDVTMVQLPAINTPQFDTVRNRLGKHAQPVPPIFQPELVAKAVMHVIEHPTRELWIGGPTVKAILGQRLIPGVLDKYLAKHAYEDQVTDELPPTWLDNVDAVLPGDRGAHGDFDARAKSFSSQLWLRLHRGAIAAATLAVLGGAWWLRRSEA